MSRAVLIIGFLAMAYASFVYYPKWKLPRTEATISWDVSGYYLYLPAIFIYKDIRQLAFKPGIDEKYYPSSSPYQSFGHWSGRPVMKYTCGMAVLYMPFFLMAHGIASCTGQLADGYSPIYQFFISFGSLVYACLGLFFFRKLLLRYFEDHIVALTITILLFATNYFDYASITGAMAHNYLFTLYATLMLCIDNFYKSERWNWLFVASSLIGLMVLIRPTEVISLILVVGWKLDSIESLINRVQWYWRSWKKLVLAGFFFLIFPALQLAYWKYVATEWIVYSYQDQGFSWLEGHHILQGLFSYRAGWLVYTPVMVLSLIGLGMYWIKRHQWTWMLTSFILISLYLTFAWDEWTYGGSLGQRALVQHYPVFMMGMIPLLKTFDKIKWVRWVLYFGIAICIYYNLWLTHQAHRGGIYEAGMMNKAYFWQTVLKSKAHPEDKKLLDTNEPARSFNLNSATLQVDSLFAPEGPSCVDLGKKTIIFNGNIPNGNIKAIVDVRASAKEWDVWQMAQLIIAYQNAETPVKTVFIRLHRFLNDHEEKLVDLITQSPKQPYDHVEISIWNPSSKTICVKGLKLYVIDDAR